LHLILEVGDGGLVGDEFICKGQWLAKLLCAKENGTTYN
jgi:hypothetical protein